MSTQNKYRLCILALVICGLLMVYSSSHIWAEYKFEDELYYFKRQAFFVIIGLVLMHIFSKIDYHLYEKYHRMILFVTFVLLGLVLIPGIGSVRGGSRSWFSFGGLSLQPSEFFKMAIVIKIACFLSEHYLEAKKLSSVLRQLVYVFLGFFLIMLQPDFGTGAVMVCGVMVMLMASALSFKYFIWLGMIGVAGIVGLIASAPYRMARILAYLDPFSDPLGSGFQAIQSLYAIGPGGLLGVGFNQSFQKHFYLPEPQTDFIYAIFCEEFGFVGGVFLLGLFFYLIYLGVKIALNSEDLLGFYLALGITSMIAIQVIINLGVVVGLFPVTGVTLPFISYGGSSLTLLLILAGILCNISFQQARDL